MTVGGSASHDLVDHPFCRDGKNRLTLRGTGLAGALVATARKLYRKLPTSISVVEAGEGVVFPSLWRVFTSHPQDEERLEVEFRHAVGILQATGAAAETVLYDAEVLPRGTRWPLVLEVVTGAPGGEEAEGIAAAVLCEWAAGRGWLGGAVARGMGWIRLHELRAYRLGSEHCTLWPRADLAWEGRLQGLEGQVAAIPAADFGAQFTIPQPDREWWYMQVEGRLRAGEAESGYGMDGLSVGAHGSVLEWQQWDTAALLPPEGIKKDVWSGDFKPDHAMMAGHCPGGGWELMIPGSTLRGVLRHALAARLRGAGEAVLDPNSPDGQQLNLRVRREGVSSEAVDRVAALFGSVSHSSPLLLRDAYLEQPAWQAVLLQHHAEDEFTAGVFESSKFNRLMLLDAVFSWGLMIEGGERAAIEQAWDLLLPVLKIGALGHLAVGGGVWRGAGWVRWEWENPVWVQAGEGLAGSGCTTAAVAREG